MARCLGSAQRVARSLSELFSTIPDITKSDRAASTQLLPARIRKRDSHTVAISASTLRTSSGSSNTLSGLSRCRTSGQHYATNIGYAGADGSSIYNALQAQLKTRLSHGLQVRISYTS